MSVALDDFTSAVLAGHQRTVLVSAQLVRGTRHHNYGGAINASLDSSVCVRHAAKADFFLFGLQLPVSCGVAIRGLLPPNKAIDSPQRHWLVSFSRLLEHFGATLRFYHTQRQKAC